MYCDGGSAIPKLRQPRKADSVQGQKQRGSPSPKHPLRRPQLFHEASVEGQGNGIRKPLHIHCRGLGVLSLKFNVAMVSTPFPRFAARNLKGLL